MDTNIRISKEMYHLLLEIYPRVMFENFTFTQANSGFEQMAAGMHARESSTYAERNYYLYDKNSELKFIVSRPRSGVYVIGFMNMRDEFLKDMWDKAFNYSDTCIGDKYLRALDEFIKENEHRIN